MRFNHSRFALHNLNLYNLFISFKKDVAAPGGIEKWYFLNRDEKLKQSLTRFNNRLVGKIFKLKVSSPFIFPVERDRRTSRAGKTVRMAGGRQNRERERGERECKQNKFSHQKCYHHNLEEGMFVFSSQMQAYLTVFLRDWK